MKPAKTKRQNGIALVSALLILILLSAVAVGLVLTANTETAVNTNYRQERTLDFAARAGIEEVRNRLTPGSAHSLVAPSCTSATACLAATSVVPSTSNNGVLYVRGGATPASVTPWTANTVYTDDELCHDGYGLVTVQSSDVHCSSVPAGSSWYASATSNAPWAGTTAALPFQWVRVSWKLNGSVQNYPVNAASCPSLGSAGCSTPVCFNGAQEVLLPAGKTACSQMTPTANPVYLLTSLALNPTTAARKMMQAEVALSPPTVSNVAGFFATGTGCGVFTMSGNVSTDGFSSAGGGTYATTHSNSTGGIGANGNLALNGSVSVGGDIYAPNATIGACPAGVSEAGGAGMTAGNTVVSQPPVTVPTPPVPNPLPPTTALTNPGSLVPGNYGNISLNAHKTLTLSPGTYNINSLAMTGNSTIQIVPAGAVIINVAGQGTSTPIDMTGGSLANSTMLAANFQLNYAGTGNVNISGGNTTYAVINAPNAALSFHGGGDFYGSATGATITDAGNVSLHFDTTLTNNVTTPATNFTEISMRAVAY